MPIYQCPLLWLIPDRHIKSCLEIRCAWFDVEERQCAILTLARTGIRANALRSGTSEVEILEAEYETED